MGLRDHSRTSASIEVSISIEPFTFLCRLSDRLILQKHIPSLLAVNIITSKELPIGQWMALKFLGHNQPIDHIPCDQTPAQRCHTRTARAAFNVEQMQLPSYLCIIYF